jgi:hypothetical protein
VFPAFPVAGLCNARSRRGGVTHELVDSGNKPVHLCPLGSALTFQLLHFTVRHTDLLQRARKPNIAVVCRGARTWSHVGGASRRCRLTPSNLIVCRGRPWYTQLYYRPHWLRSAQWRLGHLCEITRDQRAFHRQVYRFNTNQLRLVLTFRQVTWVAPVVWPFWLIWWFPGLRAMPLIPGGLKHDFIALLVPFYELLCYPFPPGSFA